MQNYYWIEVLRADGRRALVRPDWIGCISQNKEPNKVKGEPNIDCLTIHLTNNVSMNIIGDTEETLLDRLQQAVSCKAHIMAMPKPVVALEPEPAAA